MVRLQDALQDFERNTELTTALAVVLNFSLGLRVGELVALKWKDGYPDVQIFIRTFREMESVVEQYNRDLAEWEY